jgi:NAD(P)-dependent dehydrogenase (short-subunit alcohol dehydrogenase family)
MGKLDGRVALITGSGRNIGRATALRLAAEGAHVVVNACSNEVEAESVAREVRDRGAKALPILADVARRDQVAAMVARALAEFGRIDILINNAAIRPHKPFTELTIDDWERVRGVILDGAFYCTQAVVPSMVENRYGRILFFTGDGAFTGGSAAGCRPCPTLDEVGFPGASIKAGAAVDMDRLAGDEAAVVADQKQAGGGDFVDMPLAAERDAGGTGYPPAIPFGVVPTGIDAARRDDVHPNVLGGEFGGETARQPDEAHLRCRHVGAAAVQHGGDRPARPLPCSLPGAR